MTKARIEGLLAAFSKLKTSDKQHTFVETDSVRYVYQPMEKIYMVLITTKASNILEDLETLRLFSRVLSEYCRTLDENDIIENAFNLIFAFDEIVALGYRESVNLAQIKTFIEMDSHEEKIALAARESQEKEAKQKMREKAKELQRARMESQKKGIPMRNFGSSSDSFGISSSSMSSASSAPSMGISEIKKPTSTVSKPTTKNAMKLGGKQRDVDSFVDQLKSEGEKVSNLTPTAPSSSSSSMPARPKLDVNMDEVHCRVEDKLTVRIGRDGGLQAFELSGLLTLRISDEKYGKIKIFLDNNDQRGIQLQTHPNIDKELFRNKSQIALKNPQKPFPMNTDVGVLKWRYTTQDESAIPLTINCWPSENGDGGCDINIEYELENTKLELQDVVIVIPMPMGVVPSITECDGVYNHDPRKHNLQWNLPVIDAANKQGAMEFSAPSSIPGDFFPIEVSFVSKTLYADLNIAKIVMVDDESSQVKYSSETSLHPEKYEIV